MPLINAILVRWAGGWSEAVDDASIAAYGRHEALLGLGAIQSRAEMERVAHQQLAIYATPRVEISADVAPVDDTDTPYLSYLVGDTLLLPAMTGTPGRERVLALTVAEDQDGQISYAPELRNVLLTQNERIEQAVKKMSDGTIRGDSKVATPVAQITVNNAKDCCPPQPPVGLVITSVASSYGDGGAQSEYWYGTGAAQHYHLASFTARPLGWGPVDGAVPELKLWQYVPGGDGNFEIAEIVLGFNYDPSVTYTATLDAVDMIAGSEFAIGFRQNGTFTAAIAVTAHFSNGSGTITLPWGIVG